MFSVSIAAFSLDFLFVSIIVSISHSLTVYVQDTAEKMQNMAEEVTLQRFDEQQKAFHELRAEHQESKQQSAADMEAMKQQSAADVEAMKQKHEKEKKEWEQVGCCTESTALCVLVSERACLLD